MAHKRASLLDRLKHEECDGQCEQPCKIMHDLAREAADALEQATAALANEKFGLCTCPLHRSGAAQVRERKTYGKTL